MQKQWRKYYKPGFISLALLPIICCIYLGYKYVHGTKQYTIPFPIIDDTYMHQHHAVDDYFPPARQYKKITLTGQSADDIITIKQLDDDIKSIISKEDTVNGIRVQFGNNIKFQTLITIIDVCNIDSAAIFGFDEDDFFITPFSKHKFIPWPQTTCRIIRRR